MKEQEEKKDVKLYQEQQHKATGGDITLTL